MCARRAARGKGRRLTVSSIHLLRERRKQSRRKQGWELWFLKKFHKNVPLHLPRHSTSERWSFRKVFNADVWLSGITKKGFCDAKYREDVQDSCNIKNKKQATSTLCIYHQPESVHRVKQYVGQGWLDQSSTLVLHLFLTSQKMLLNIFNNLSHFCVFYKLQQNRCFFLSKVTNNINASPFGWKKLLLNSSRLVQSY